MSNTKSSECEVGVADIDPILQTARVAVESMTALKPYFQKKNVKKVEK